MTIQKIDKIDVSIGDPIVDRPLASLFEATLEHAKREEQQDPLLRFMNTGVNLEDSTPVFGRPGVYLSSPLKSDDLTMGKAASRLSLSIPIMNDPSGTGATQLKDVIRRAVANGFGGSYADLTVPSNLTNQLAAIQSSRLPDVAANNGWKFTPQVYVTVNGSDAVRSSASEWATAVNSPASTLSNLFSPSPVGIAKSHGPEAAVSAGFSISNSAAVLSWRFGETPGSAHLGILRRGNGGMGGEPSGASGGVSIVNHSASNSIIITSPNVGNIELPADLISEVKLLSKAAST